MKDPRVWMATLALAAVAWSIAPLLVPPQAPVVAEEMIPRIRYVCRKSGEVFTMPLTGDVLEHPTTGEPTLVPAVYDARRKKWSPGPPLDVMQREGLLRPAGESMLER